MLFVLQGSNEPFRTSRTSERLMSFPQLWVSLPNEIKTETQVESGPATSRYLGESQNWAKTLVDGLSQWPIAPS